MNTHAGAVRVYPNLEKGWTGYKQRVGSRYASIKSAEIEVLTCSCVLGYHVYKDVWGAAIGELLTWSREPTKIFIPE